MTVTDDVDPVDGSREADPAQVDPGEGHLSEGHPEEAEVPEAALTDDATRTIPPFREVAEIRKPSTLGGIVFLGVLATALIGIGIAATGAWRTGATWLAASLVTAAAARVVLDDDSAGMLRVRRKVLDAVILIGAGAAIVFLAWSIPGRSR